METNEKKDTTEPKGKARIYNVIILDKSGSMSSIARQAIDGVNETLGAIRSSQLRDPEQDNTVTLVAFCGCEMRTIFDNVPIADAKDITEKDYRPCCMTPLYDAVGTTITRVHSLTENQRVAVAVTIITDGYENASHEFSGKALCELINKYKKEGWMFAYVGAEHDVEAVAATLSIDNVMRFDRNPESTSAMFCREASSKSRWMNRVKGRILKSMALDDEDFKMAMSEESENYYD